MYDLDHSLLATNGFVRNSADAFPLIRVAFLMRGLMASCGVDGGSMVITVINDETDYEAGHAVYVGYELDGTTYSVTNNGYDTHTFTYTGCI